MAIYTGGLMQAKEEKAAAERIAAQQDEAQKGSEKQK